MWLLDKLVNGGLSGDLQHDTVLGRLVNLGDLGYTAYGLLARVPHDESPGGLTDHDSALSTVANVEITQGLEGVRACHVRVEHKEGRLILAQDFARQGQRTS